MNAEKYIGVLEGHLEPFMTLNGCDTFMHDGAPCHKAKKVSQWLKDRHVGVLDWPGNSPDLNPIENMWNYMKNDLQTCDTGSIPKLTTAIKKLWCTRLTPDYCKKLSHSMPDRIQQVLNGRGAMTKY